MMKYFFSLLIFCCLIQIIVTCANVDEGESYGDIFANGLILTESNHQGGYGRSECFFCHNIENIHVTDHSGGSVDVEAIRQITINEGAESCASCHSETERKEFLEKPNAIGHHDDHDVIINKYGQTKETIQAVCMNCHNKFPDSQAFISSDTCTMCHEAKELP